MKKKIGAVLALLLVAVFFISQTGYQSNAVVDPVVSTIETNASSQIDVAPDLAYVNAVITIVDETKSVAVNTNKSSTDALLKALSAAGVAAKDIKTTGYYVSSYIDRIPTDPNAPNPVYKEVKKIQVTSNFKITLRKLSEAGDILDKLTGVDNVDINNVTYALSNISAYKKEAIAKATALAKENISLAADAAGVKLSKLKSLTVDFNNNPYVPYQYLSKAQQSAPVYQNPEDIKITASVSMAYFVK